MRTCGTCARSGRGTVPATYRRHTHAGLYSNDLCDSCCGHWLINALDDNNLMPSTVELLKPET